MKPKTIIPRQQPPAPKLLDQVRNVIRVKHYSFSTEKTYIDWIKQFIKFHGLKHPKEMGAKEVSTFLTYSAVRRKGSPSTQNQALCALVFLYKEVLNAPLDELDFGYAKRHERIPVVFTQDEVARILLELHGSVWLVVSLLC